MRKSHLAILAAGIGFFASGISSAINSNDSSRYPADSRMATANWRRRMACGWKKSATSRTSWPASRLSRRKKSDLL